MPASLESATLEPNAPWPLSSLAVSFAPCCVHVLPERANTHAAPRLPLSPSRADQRRAPVTGQRHAAAELPCAGLVARGELRPLRATTWRPSARTPTRPLRCCRPRLRRSAPCCRQPTAQRSSRTGLDQRWTHPRPSALTPAGSSRCPSARTPTPCRRCRRRRSADQRRVPSLESATLMPKLPAPLSPLAVSFNPCWVHVRAERANTHAAPTEP